MTTRVALAAICGLLAGGCVGVDRTDRTSLAIYAASSLAEAFGELEAVFERAYPDADVTITFAGSQILRIQIEEGAPADVFASADPDHMVALVDAGYVPEGRAFALNELVVIVPSDNPADIELFADLTSASRLVLGTAEVPVGRYARQALASANSLVRPGFAAAVLDGLVSEEPNVRLTRSKVELGEADAAIVYRTDVTPSSRVRAISIPPEVNVQAEYLIGAVARKGGSALANDWIEMVLSREGRTILERHGFLVD